MTPPTALVAGEALIDVFATPRGLEHVPGGSPMNVAIGLARLGVPTSLATSLGEDEPGRRIADHLREHHVDLVTPLSRTQDTSTATCTVGADGAATYDFDVTWNRTDIPDVETPILVHTGSVAAFLQPGAAAVQRWFAASSRALRSFDPNIRPGLVGDQEAARETVRTFASHSDIVKLSDEDAAWLFPGVDDNTLARILDPDERRVVVLTRGANGCSAWSSGTRIDRPAPETDLADTVGAGDSFMAGLLAALIRHPRSTDRSAPFESDDVERALQTALSCAAITVSHRGAYAPSLADLGRRHDLEDKDRRS